MMQVSDARILGRHADAAIIVLRSGKTPRGAALTVKRRLADDRLPVLGTILNGWEPGQGSSSYYYG
jgi:Mrp family chromosome partitioning ATPase